MLKTLVPPQALLKNVTTVSLPSVLDPVAFESVLTSAYTGQLSIVHDDIVHYVTVASFLQMWHIVDKCTEMLKGPRPSGDGGSAAQPASRQQSPSSTESLYVEREGRRRDRRPDALPPLATWRRPQQLARWARPRASSAQHMADSQLDGPPGYAESVFSSCEEALASNHTVGPNTNSRLSGGGAVEASKLKGRCHPRGGQLTTERLPEKEGEESQNGRKSERTETEADEGVGEDGEARREALSHCGKTCTGVIFLDTPTHLDQVSTEVLMALVELIRVGAGFSQLSCGTEFFFFRCLKKLLFPDLRWRYYYCNALLSSFCLLASWLSLR